MIFRNYVVLGVSLWSLVDMSSWKQAMVGNKTGRKTGKEDRPKFLEHLVAETLSQGKRKRRTWELWT